MGHIRAVFMFRKLISDSIRDAPMLLEIVKIIGDICPVLDTVLSFDRDPPQLFYRWQNRNFLTDFDKTRLLA